jgi:hypothetical protein
MQNTAAEKLLQPVDTSNAVEKTRRNCVGIEATPPSIGRCLLIIFEQCDRIRLVKPCYSKG